MPPTPWVILAAVRHVQAIRAQLQASQGIVGYSLLARVLRLQFWTLSAWNDRAALEGFVRADPHLAVISDLRGHMGATRFIEWRAKGAQLPPTWAEAMRRFQTEAIDG